LATKTPLCIAKSYDRVVKRMINIKLAEVYSVIY